MQDQIRCIHGDYSLSFWEQINFIACPSAKVNFGGEFWCTCVSVMQNEFSVHVPARVPVPVRVCLCAYLFLTNVTESRPT